MELIDYYVDGKLIVRSEVLNVKSKDVKMLFKGELGHWRMVEVYVEVVLMELKGVRKEFYVVEVNGKKWLSDEFKIEKGKRTIENSLRMELN